MQTDILDFPTAWAIQKEMKDGDHDPKCSSVPGHHPLSGPHFLCDCGAVIREWERRWTDTPNEETQRAMAELDQGRGQTYESVDALFDDLED